MSTRRILKANLLLLIALTCTQLHAQTATTTALSILASDNPVSTISTGTAITLTATVTGASSAIKQGQVNFCNAAAAHCTDIRILGTAALTSAGTATLILRPGPGTYSYKAEFAGTPGAATPYAASASTSAALTVTGVYQSAATIISTGTPGNYTLTASVYGFNKNESAPAPTGTVSFIDNTTNNSTLTTAAPTSSASGPYWINPVGITAGVGTNTIVSGDFNNDGNPDFAIGIDSTTALLAVYLGDGRGGFQAVANSSIAASGDPVLVADFNGDGKPDILMSNSPLGPSGLGILLGNGDGTFTPAPGNPISTNYGISPIVSADFNGDGIPDLALAGGYYLVVLLGNGDGSFTQVPISSSSIAEALFGGIVTGDFNNDGREDVAAVENYSVGQTITLYLGNGDGTFTQGSTIAVSNESGGSAINLTAADFNGDGKLDLATPIYGNPASLAIYLGNGDGTFTPTTDSPIPTIMWANTVRVGDFNGDGIPDIYVTGPTDVQDLAIHLGNGDGTFTTVPSANTPELPCCFYTTLADFNNDGVTDIIASSFYDGQADIYLTAPTLSTATASDISIIGQTPQQILASYAGNSTYGPSQSTTTPLEVQVAAPTFSPTPGTIGQTQFITITTTTPNATIYYQASGTYNLPQWTPYNGPLQFPALGTITLQAYAVSLNYGQSPTATANYTVLSTPTVTVTPGSTNITKTQALPVTVAVMGGSGNLTPTGSVILTGGGYTSPAVTLSGGTATINIPSGSLAVGNDSLSASYTPDSTSSSIYNSASSSMSVTVTVPPSFTLSASPTSVSVAQNASVTNTITVTDVGGFAGTVALAASGPPSEVTASFVAGTTAGTQVLTLTASSTATVGGPVTLTVVGTSGVLSATTTVLLTVTAEPTFGSSGAGNSDAAITIEPGVTTGNTSTISVAGTNGYSGTVTLSCSVSPAAAKDPPACSLFPASVTLSGSTAQTSTLTVTTTAASSAQNQMKKLLWPPAGGTVLALVLLIGVPRTRRNWLATLALAVLFTSISVIGCSGGSVGGGGPVENSGTPAGRYTVTVTGTGTSNSSSNSVTATVGTVTLTVN